MASFMTKIVCIWRGCPPCLSVFSPIFFNVFSDQAPDNIIVEIIITFISSNPVQDVREPPAPTFAISAIGMALSWATSTTENAQALLRLLSSRRTLCPWAVELAPPRVPLVKASYAPCRSGPREQLGHAELGHLRVASANSLPAACIIWRFNCSQSVNWRSTLFVIWILTTSNISGCSMLCLAPVQLRRWSVAHSQPQMGSVTGLPALLLDWRLPDSH